MNFQEVLNQFTINPDRMPGIIEDIHRQMEDGLKGRPSSLAMIPSYADAATGTEQGKFLAMDFGGTNLRILLVELEAGRIKSRIVSGKNPIDEKTAEGDVLFDQVAAALRKFLTEHDLLTPAAPLPLGFTFSFPVRQHDLRSGTLIKWTKEFRARNVEGHEVVGLLEAALERAHLSTVVHVAALVNDTVGTMAAYSYEHPETIMGVIMGTGTNACYRECIANIPKLANPPAGHSHTIVNMEWGNYDSMPATPYDEALFAETGTAGMRFEKMTSGRYMVATRALGTLLMRRVIADCIASGGLFEGLATEAGWTFDAAGALSGPDMDRIAADKAPYDCTRLIILRLAGPPAQIRSDGGKLEEARDDPLSLHFHELAFVGALARAILARSATLAGIMVAAVASRLHAQRPAEAAAPTTAAAVAVDGSVFHHSPGYAGAMQAAADAALAACGLGEGRCPIVLAHAEDGSGVGAAIIAATAASTATSA